MKKDIRLKDIDFKEVKVGEVAGRVVSRLKHVEETIEDYKKKIAESDGLKKMYKTLAYRYEQERFWLVYILTNKYPKEEEF